MRRRKKLSVSTVIGLHSISIKTASGMQAGRHTRHRDSVPLVDPSQLYWMTKFSVASPLPAVIAPVVGAYLAVAVKR